MSPRARACTCAALAALGVVIVAALAWPFTIDDAFVTARYAERLARGQGYTMNDGPPTDGVTGPLALVPEVVAASLGASPVAAGKLTGVAATALALALLAWTCARRSGVEAAMFVVIVTLRPTLGIWSAGGLETGLATLAIAASAVAAGAGDRQPWLLFMSCACVPWLRPELVPVALTLALVSGARRSGIAGVALGLATVIVFRLVLFGSPLPLAAHAKPAELALGAEHVLRALFVVLGLGAIPLGLALRGGSGRAPAIAALAGALCVVAAGGDWMPGFRLFAPLIPLFALAMARALADLWEHGRRAWAAILVAMSIAIPIADLAAEVPAARQSGLARERAGAPLADWLREHTERVALVDVGYLGYRSGRTVIDLGGITDPQVARLPGGHAGKLVDPGWLAARAPDAIVLHSTIPPIVDSQGRLQVFSGHPVERRVASMGWVRARMRVARADRYAEGYWYVTLVPREAPPGGS
ncbi:MAG: hypothetical protein IT378_03960 [Sandaracinaceae bacterium]|nr:hypothetical protein [Sandaracinaceae bacterium]